MQLTFLSQQCSWLTMTSCPPPICHKGYIVPKSRTLVIVTTHKACYATIILFLTHHDSKTARCQHAEGMLVFWRIGW